MSTDKVLSNSNMSHEKSTFFLTNATQRESDDMVVSVSEETMYVTKCVVSCFLDISIAVFGMLGNMMNILVLRRHGLQESATILLTSLAVCDLAYCFLTLSSLVKCPLLQIDPDLRRTVQTFQYLYPGTFRTTFNLCSSNHVLLIAIERFVAVFWPFSAPRIFTASRMKVLVVGIYLYVFVPMLSLTQSTQTYEWVKDPLTNKMYAAKAFSKFYQRYYEIMNLFGINIVNHLYFTTSVLVVMLSCIAISLKLSINRRRMDTRMSRSRARGDKKAGKMLFVVCVCYTALSLPPIATEIYNSFYAGVRDWNPMSIYLSEVIQVFYTANCAINFILYVTVSRKFAATYRKLMCPKRKD